MSQRKEKEKRRMQWQLVPIKQSKSLISNRGLREIIRENLVFLVGLTLVVAAIYFNAMWGDFVSDDYASITQNPGVTDARYMLGTFNLMSASTFLLAKIFGIGSSIPFHIFSLLIFILNCWAAFGLIYLLFGQKVAQATTLLFGMLPIHVEAVSWISGRPYLMVSLFVLWALVFVVLYLQRGEAKYIGWLVFCLFLGLAVDRIRPLAFFFLAVLMLLSFGKQFNRQINLTKIFLAGFGVVAVLMVLFWPLIRGRIESVNSGYNRTDSVFYDPFFQYPTAMAKYLQLLLVPVDLTLYHTMYVAPVWLNWLILIFYLLAVVYFYFKNRGLFFALVFIFAATAPSMAPVKVSWLVAERYMFLGSLGFCLFLVLAFLPMAEKYKWLVAPGYGVLILVYAARIVIRNDDWQTNHKLWVNTVQVSPNSHNAWNNIGDDYDKLGDLENAVKGFTQSTVMKPNYADAYHNRANIYFKMGRFDLARDSYETALKYSPTLYQTYLSLTQVDLAQGQVPWAISHAEKLVKLQPQNPQSYYVLGVVLARVGMVDKAKEELKKALRIAPNYQLASQALVVLEGQK